MLAQGRLPGKSLQRWCSVPKLELLLLELPEQLLHRKNCYYRGRDLHLCYCLVFCLVTLAAALATARIFFPLFLCFSKGVGWGSGVVGGHEMGRASVIRSVGGSVLFFCCWLSGQIHCWAVVMALHNSLYMLQMWISAHGDALYHCFWICPPDPS